MANVYWHKERAAERALKPNHNKLLDFFISLACYLLYAGFADDPQAEPKYVSWTVLTLLRTVLYVCIRACKKRCLITQIWTLPYVFSTS